MGKYGFSTKLSISHISCCQGVAKSLNRDCIARMEPSKAGF